MLCVLFIESNFPNPLPNHYQAYPGDGSKPLKTKTMYYDIMQVEDTLVVLFMFGLVPCHPSHIPAQTFYARSGMLSLLGQRLHIMKKRSGSRTKTLNPKP